MNMMETLSWLRDELTDAGVARDEVVLFGSTVLWLHGIRGDVGDVDLFVTPRAWTALTKKLGWRVRYPTPGDPPLLEWTGGWVVVHAFLRWTSRDEWLSVDEAWREAENVAGWLAIPVELVRRWKVEAHRANPGSEVHAKHARDVALIDAHAERLIK